MVRRNNDFDVVFSREEYARIHLLQTIANHCKPLNVAPLPLPSPPLCSLPARPWCRLDRSARAPAEEGQTGQTCEREAGRGGGGEGRVVLNATTSPSSVHVSISINQTTNLSRWTEEGSTSDLVALFFLVGFSHAAPLFKKKARTARCSLSPAVIERRGPRGWKCPSPRVHGVMAKMLLRRRSMHSMRSETRKDATDRE